MFDPLRHAVYRGAVTATAGDHIVAAKKDAGVSGLEKSLEDLESLVERLENEQLPLAEALKEFERGVKLMRDCQTTLKEAEQTVEILLKKTADADAEPFEPDDAGD